MASTRGEGRRERAAASEREARDEARTRPGREDSWHRGQERELHAKKERSLANREETHPSKEAHSETKIRCGGPTGMQVELDHKGEHWPHGHDMKPRPR